MLLLVKAVDAVVVVAVVVGGGGWFLSLLVVVLKAVSLVAGLLFIFLSSCWIALWLLAVDYHRLFACDTNNENDDNNDNNTNTNNDNIVWIAVCFLLFLVSSCALVYAGCRLCDCLWRGRSAQQQGQQQ
jgi:hypothetical protein